MPRHSAAKGWRSLCASLQIRLTCPPTSLLPSLPGSASHGSISLVSIVTAPGFRVITLCRALPLWSKGFCQRMHQQQKGCCLGRSHMFPRHPPECGYVLSYRVTAAALLRPREAESSPSTLACSCVQRGIILELAAPLPPPTPLLHTLLST